MQDNQTQYSQVNSELQGMIDPIIISNAIFEGLRCASTFSLSDIAHLFSLSALDLQLC